MRRSWRPTFSRCGLRARFARALRNLTASGLLLLTVASSASRSAARSKINTQPAGCSPAGRLSRRRPDPLNHCPPTTARLPHARRSARDATARCSSWASCLVVPRERLPVAPKRRIFDGRTCGDAAILLPHRSLGSETRNA